ncbi:tRNA (adenosine(37)-N6)-dimethylallyltransferase MiaA, partial [Candidatus Uhrbacteria bacterium]|nr:tRNA (adenosine(37)-N6)-dimethylallyltransferase MiaA [Candidatus Uhrbacteria bacterium]
LLENWQLPMVAPNLKLRQKLEKELAQKGLPVLYKRLIKLDPACAKFIDKHNPRRVIRALEVTLTTGQMFSQSRGKLRPLYNALVLGINLPREKLYQRINLRVDQMIKAGLSREVKSLSKRYSWKAPGLNGLGYRQFRDCFQGRASLEQVVEEIKKQTRHYAKRQMTWFRKMPKVKWIKTEKQAVSSFKKFGK